MIYVILNPSLSIYHVQFMGNNSVGYQGSSLTILGASNAALQARITQNLKVGTFYFI